MKSITFSFFLIIILLVALNSVLLASPNLFGKVGLVIYKYHYLKTLPKTLLTVSIVAFSALLISIVIHALSSKGLMGKGLGIFLMFIFLILSGFILAKVSLDFTKWSYSKTGLRFRIGAHMLPIILIIIFGRGVFAVLSIKKLEPLPVANETDSNSENPYQDDVGINPDTKQP